MECCETFYISSLADFPAWQGGKDSLEQLLELNKISDVESLISEVFSDKIPTVDDINNFLWFDWDYIAERLEIKEA